MPMNVRPLHFHMLNPFLNSLRGIFPHHNRKARDLSFGARSLRIEQISLASLAIQLSSISYMSYQVICNYFCYNTVHGGCSSWSGWTSCSQSCGWTSCSKSCGSGSQERPRTCTSPLHVKAGDHAQEQHGKRKSAISRHALVRNIAYSTSSYNSCTVLGPFLHSLRGISLFSHHNRKACDLSFNARSLRI